MKVAGVPRRRRRQAHCTPDMKEKSCCLYDLIVDFEVIPGYDQKPVLDSEFPALMNYLINSRIW